MLPFGLEWRPGCGSTSRYLDASVAGIRLEESQTSNLVENPTDHVCEPQASMPAWWSAFLFHVLNPRQICMYVYLAMLSDEKGECSPTIDQIREDLGLYSSSMVFEALSALEDLGFIQRQRQAFAGVRSRRNLYRRPSCELTLLRLLERGRIDGELRSTNPTRAPASPESQALVFDGLRELFGDAYATYDRAPQEAKRETLMTLLRQAIEEESAGDR
jgi:predicted transcriptional regulator